MGNAQVSRGESFRQLLRGWSPLARWRVALGFLAAALVAWLVLAEKPWQIDAGGKMKLSQVVALWMWWAALLDLIVVGGLFVLCPWWTKPLAVENRKSKIENPRWFWPLVVLAMALAAAFALPRMTFGLWDDEELSARQAIVGKFQTDKETGVVRFRLHRWNETLFDYRTPNNHVLHSILSRLSVDAWRGMVRPAGLPFAEWPMRVPALIFGVLAVAALAWFLKETGFAAAGVVAAFLLALHPWHIRYASEARGYSMVICLVPVLFVCWHRAMKSGAWKWWAASAVTQFVMVYTHPGILFLLVILNLLTLPVMALSRECARPFAAQSGRWFCVNALSALPAFLLMLPLMPQARLYFEQEGYRGVLLGWTWIKGALAFLLVGGPWTAPEGYPAINAPPGVAMVLMAAAAVLLVVGLGRFASRGGLESCLALTILAAPLMTFGFSRFRKMMIYESYIIYVLPVLVGFVAIGIWTLCGMLRKLPAGRAAVPLGAALLVLGFFAVTHSFRSWLVTHPLQQIPESVLFSRGSLDPHQGAGVLTASFCIPPYLYDGQMIRTDSVAEFIAVLKRADRENKPLLFNIGMPWAAREYSPGMWSLFNNPQLFSAPRMFPGMDAGLDRIVALYLPGSADSFDFSPYKLEER